MRPVLLANKTEIEFFIHWFTVNKTPEYEGLEGGPLELGGDALPHCGFPLNLREDPDFNWKIMINTYQFINKFIKDELTWESANPKPNRNTRRRPCVPPSPKTKTIRTTKPLSLGKAHSVSAKLKSLRMTPIWTLISSQSNRRIFRLLIF